MYQLKLNQIYNLLLILLKVLSVSSWTLYSTIHSVWPVKQELSLLLVYMWWDHCLQQLHQFTNLS